MTSSSRIILRVLVSLQRALLGYVTPDLRAVEVIIEDEQNFNVFFYYNRELSKDEEELSSLAETKFMMDFPSPDYHVKGILKILPFPNKIPKIGFPVYKRYEK
jgi:hypothetical protein